MRVGRELVEIAARRAWRWAVAHWTPLLAGTAVGLGVLLILAAVQGSVAQRELARTRAEVQSARRQNAAVVQSNRLLVGEAEAARSQAARYLAHARQDERRANAARAEADSLARGRAAMRAALARATTAADSLARALDALASAEQQLATQDRVIDAQQAALVAKDSAIAAQEHAIGMLHAAVDSATAQLERNATTFAHVDRTLAHVEPACRVLWMRCPSRKAVAWGGVVVGALAVVAARRR
ncbi:MAG TPA: hypothetical protein VFN76_10100 [Candidatus Limnocylindria bacterium]|nr:hypothetical protein [Candidatus Limnocylindria bacterium]